MVPMMENKIRSMRKLYPELLMGKESKERSEWLKNPQNKQTFDKHNNLCWITVEGNANSFSNVNLATTMANIVHARAMNDERFASMNSNDESIGGGSRYLFPFSNMVVELLTGTVRKPLRTDMLSWTSNYPYPMSMLDDDCKPSDECKRI